MLRHYAIFWRRAIDALFSCHADAADFRLFLLPPLIIFDIADTIRYPPPVIAFVFRRRC